MGIKHLKAFGIRMQIQKFSVEDLLDWVTIKEVLSRALLLWVVGPKIHMENLGHATYQTLE